MLIRQRLNMMTVTGNKEVRQLSECARVLLEAVEHLTSDEEEYPISSTWAEGVLTRAIDALRDDDDWGNSANHLA